MPLKKEACEVPRYWLPRTQGKWVFPSPKKAGAHLTDFGKAFDKAVKRAGLQRIIPDFYAIRSARKPTAMLAGFPIRVK